MRILIYRHVPFESSGLIETVLLPRATVEYADLYLAPAARPDPASYDGLIFMGGPMSVNDDLPYIHEELEILRQAALRRQPVFGICLGAQLIAKAMGAQVRRNPVKEIGWYAVHLTGAAAQDPLLAGLGESLEIFQWHGETFDLPRGATLLAWSPTCHHQAFRLDSFYGLQFHPEVTPEMIADWCVQDCNCGDVREAPAPIDVERGREWLPILCEQLFGRWCDLLRKEVPAA